METRLQRRVQRYGWDLAALDYDPLWELQLARARAALLVNASPTPGERVLDIACGTGLVTFDAARLVGPRGHVLGIDLAGKMIDTARSRCRRHGVPNATFARMDAEKLDLPDGGFDVALCSLGLMYMPDPAQALREMKRVLRPGGCIAAAVWGERKRCGWAPVFEIVDAEVHSDVCPQFFHLGRADSLPRLCSDLGLTIINHQRIETTMTFDDADHACDAAFVGGPVALAWSRFSAEAKRRARLRYLEAIEGWRVGNAYRIPGEFVIVACITGNP